MNNTIKLIRAISGEIAPSKTLGESMILANKSGMLISVTMIGKTAKGTQLKEAGCKTIHTLRPDETNRKLFDGEKAVDDAMLWINTHLQAKEREAQMRKYPLNVQSVGTDSYIIMSKGHHDPDLFMLAVREAGFHYPLGKPTHHWVKSVPDHTGKFSKKFILVEKGTRGAWPATYTHEAYGEHQYKPRFSD